MADANLRIIRGTGSPPEPEPTRARVGGHWCREQAAVVELVEDLTANLGELGDLCEAMQIKARRLRLLVGQRAA